MLDNHNRQWNIEETDFGLRICRGDHTDTDDCHWEFLYWADEYLALKDRIKELEAVDNVVKYANSLATAKASRNAAIKDAEGWMAYAKQLKAKLARVEKENKRLIDAHLKNTEQHRPAFTLRDRSDLTHVCVWRQRFEAVQARSEAVLKPTQALEQDD